MKALALSLVFLLSCNTVGVTRERGGYAVIAPTVANAMLLDNRQIVVIDFRSTADFNGPLGHIAGALSTPLDSIENRLPELLPYQKETIVVYGDTQDEGSRGARILVAAGFKNIVLIKGGIRQWLEGGYKTVTAQ